MKNEISYTDIEAPDGINILSGLCPFCDINTSFKKVSYKSGKTMPLNCDNCRNYVVYCFDGEVLLPHAKVPGIKDLPEKINKYYQEALNCITIQSPNGAATLFRKLIHQVGIHYKVAKIKDSQSIMQIVEKMQEEGHVNKKLVEALREVKDLGNDGAHVNKNEPNMEQINTIKALVDSFLQATVLQDKNIENAQMSKNSENNSQSTN